MPPRDSRTLFQQMQSTFFLREFRLPLRWHSFCPLANNKLDHSADWALEEWCALNGSIIQRCQTAALDVQHVTCSYFDINNLWRHYIYCTTQPRNSNNYIQRAIYILAFIVRVVKTLHTNKSRKCDVISYVVTNVSCWIADSAGARFRSGRSKVQEVTMVIMHLHTRRHLLVDHNWDSHRRLNLRSHNASKRL
jgi:hypothetical protein